MLACKKSVMPKGVEHLAFSPLSRSHPANVRIAARTAVGRGKDSPAFCHRTTITIGKSFGCNSLGNRVGTLPFRR